MTVKIAARGTYNKRSAPETYNAGFLNIELGNIQRAMPSTKARTITADYTVDVTDDLVLGDASGGPISVMLPAPARVQGGVFTIKKIDATANAITIVTTVDGFVNRMILSQYNAVTVQSDGATYWILALV